MSLLVDQFRLESAPQMSLRFNIAPTQSVAVVRVIDSKRVASAIRWGLVPSWAKDLSIGSRMINSRGETVAEKPAFRSAFKRRRCLVLADGYIEWKKIGNEKRPFHIHMIDDRPFAFAGLWESWRGKEESCESESAERESPPIETCTVITTDANALTCDIHDRMPVILPEDSYDLWLDPEFECREPLQQMLKPFSSDEMAMNSISTRVNNVRHDDEACLRIQRDLF
jgi:putative SOS response-associated peptidase YedK